MKIALRSQAGISTGDVELDAQMFEAQINVPVMHQVVVAQMNARRAGTRATKTRGQVRGGGAKPYRQKGTGRARQGSIRAPHYVGGGVIWGPQPKDYSQKVPRKMKALALRSALSDRARENKIIVFESLAVGTPKTKEAATLLAEAGIAGKALVVLADDDVNVWKSFRNIPTVHVIRADQLNTYDVIAREWLVFTKDALLAVNARAASRAGAGSATADGGEGA